MAILRHINIHLDVLIAMTKINKGEKIYIVELPPLQLATEHDF